MGFRSQRPVRRKTSKTKLQQETRRKRIVFWLSYSSLVALFVGVAIYVVFFSPLMRIQSVELEGVHDIATEDIMRIADGYLHERYLWVIPKNNLLLASPGSLEQRLLDFSRRIRHVAVTKKFPDTLRIVIDERQALLVLCSGGPCYMIDEQGHAYAGVDFSQPDIKQAQLVRVIDRSGHPILMGEQVYTPEEVQTLVHLPTEFEQLGMAISGDIFMQSRVAQEVEVVTQEGWRVYMSIQQPLEKSLRSLQTFFDQVLPVGERENLDYVDIRIENKIFYTRKDSHVDQSSAIEEVDDKKKE